MNGGMKVKPNKEEVRNRGGVKRRMGQRKKITRKGGSYA